MLKIPNYIKKKMHDVAKFSSKSAEAMRCVEDWLESNGFNVVELRSGDGYSLEELEYGNDVTEEFCKKIERESEEK